MNRLPLITSFFLFIALCVSAAYWAMQLFKPPVRAIAAPPQAIQPAPRLDAAAGLLGGRPSFAVASNFQLKGVVVASDPAESVAILSANGKPALAIRTHREVVPGVTVAEVQRDHVLLSEGGVIKRIELPGDAKAQMKVDISPQVREPIKTAPAAPLTELINLPQSGSSVLPVISAPPATRPDSPRPFGNYRTPLHP